jgi:DNA-binding MarR family transcriptional regulator
VTSRSCDPSAAHVLENLLAAITDWYRAGERIHAAGVIADRSGVKLDRQLHPVLFVLAASGPLRVKEIAKQLGVLESTASRQVGHLVRLGYVITHTDRADRRALQVQLTERGIEAHRALRRSWLTVLADATTDWPKDDRETLAASLSLLVRKVHEIADR